MADDRRKQEPTALESAATGLVDRARSGQLLTPRAARWLGLGLVALLAVGVWLYLQNANRKASSRIWADYAQPGVDLADYAAKNRDTVAGRVARLERARRLFGPEGVATFAGSDREARKKGVENVAAARDEFAKLAGEFADKTLAATCRAEAAEAELALVGVPKDKTSAENLGTVAAAIDQLASATKLVGDATKAGELYKARIAELEADAPKLLAAGQELNGRFDLPPPTPPTEGGFLSQPELKLPTGITPSSSRSSPPVAPDPATMGRATPTSSRSSPPATPDPATMGRATPTNSRSTPPSSRGPIYMGTPASGR